MYSTHPLSSNSNLTIPSSSPSVLSFLPLRRIASPLSRSQSRTTRSQLRRNRSSVHSNGIHAALAPGVLVSLLFPISGNATILVSVYIFSVVFGFAYAGSLVSLPSLAVSCFLFGWLVALSFGWSFIISIIYGLHVYQLSWDLPAKYRTFPCVSLPFCPLLPSPFDVDLI